MWKKIQSKFLKELKKQDHEEMKEENHQLEIKEGYEQDEKYDESEDQIRKIMKRSTVGVILIIVSVVAFYGIMSLLWRL